MAEQIPSDPLRPDPIDGIEVYDRPLPTVWIAAFNFCFLFALMYLIWFHVLGKPGLQDELVQDQKLARQLAAARQQQLLGISEPEALKQKVSNPQLQTRGKALYAVHCASCHGEQGQGFIGPNLCDRYWLHGGNVEDLVVSVWKGWPAQGMRGFGDLLRPAEIEDLVGYLVGLKGTVPENPKGMEGVEE